MSEHIRILLVVDDPLARAGLAMLIDREPAFELIDQISSDMVEGDLIDDTPLDLIVWDLGWETAVTDLPEFDELGLPIVALIADSEEAAVVWASGVGALLLRDMDMKKLVAAVRAVMAGLFAIDPALSEELVPQLAVALPVNDEEDVVTAVTPREQEVLNLLAEGLTNKAIALQLDISDHTVKFHVNAIMSKLNAQSRTEAVVRATRLGLIAL